MKAPIAGHARWLSARGVMGLRRIAPSFSRLDRRATADGLDECARALIDLDADRPDDGAPFGDFRFEPLSQLLGRRALGHVAGLGELVFDRRVGGSRVGGGADVAQTCGGGAAGNAYPRLPVRV